MPMTHRDRFRLKSQLVEALDGEGWDHQRINLLLGEFDLQQLEDDWNGPTVAYIVNTCTDDVLVALYALAMDIDDEEVVDVVESADNDANWHPGYVRVFLSHSAVHREFMAEVAQHLAVVGIHGFVAHDTIEVSRPWQAQIERALRSMQAFVAVVHPEFNESAWCHQEAGWALGRRVPRFAIRMGVNPAGFLGSDQWPSGVGQEARDVSTVVSTWISTLPELGDSMVDGLLATLRDVNNYVDGGAAAERLAALGSLTDAQFQRLDEAFWSNDQLHGGVLPTRALEPLYRTNRRAWPPPRPTAEPEPDPEPPW